VDALILRDRDTDGDGTLDERLWVVQDANFNVTAVVDDSGEVVERYIYDPLGQATVLDAEWNVRSGGSAFAWLYLHQGGRYDVTSGLYHFRFRDYSPTLGRWTSLDPIRYAAGDVNLYRIVFNAPTTHTDPSGLDVRIESTSAVGGMHWRITVDVWNEAGAQVIGTYSISFGIDGAQPGWCISGTNSSGGGSSGSSGGGSGSGSRGSLGSGSSSTNGSGGGPAAGGKGSGVVYVDRDPPRAIIDTLRTTPDQDRAILRELQSMVDRRGNYNLLFYNCRTFSRQQFERIRRVYGPETADR
jgi:RHS repeat-associated protein